ncbi:MAG TPA: transposase [Anaerolineae bacterium]|nr:transposase [Anaerolineae bacterium]HID83864.1 transposase [Anaerolineales bacterium]HIQ08917.1 transposase [Anaerolineaceae bacterium]
MHSARKDGYSWLRNQSTNAIAWPSSARWWPECKAGASLSALQRKYGIGNLRTLRQWVQRYGTQGLRHGVMHIQTPEEAEQSTSLN